MAAISMGVPAPSTPAGVFGRNCISCQSRAAPPPLTELLMQMQRHVAAGPSLLFPRLFPRVRHQNIRFSMVFGVGHKQLALATEMTPIGKRKAPPETETGAAEKLLPS